MPDLSRLIERQYLDPDHLIDAWVRRFLRQGRPTETGELLLTLTTAIKESFVYKSRPERGTQDPKLTLLTGRGSCRDFATFMMEAVRALGLAARFVSGYLHIPNEATDDFQGGGNTHAWCQVYLPGAGWVEFDPTNGIVGNRNLIRVAVARDPRQALPLSGTFEGAATDGRIQSVVATRLTYPALCSNRHHRLTGITISPIMFMLCSHWRGSHVPAFPPVGGGAVAQHRQSHADVRPRRRERFRAPALANNRRQAGVSGLRLHDLLRLSSRSLSALAMQGVRLRFLGDFGHAVRLA
jgi:hypothetical protein